MKRAGIGLLLVLAAVGAFALLRPRPRIEISRPAAELRRSARHDAAVTRDLEIILQEASEWSEEREKAAIVLGSLGRTDELIKALAAAKDPKWIRALLIALGVDRDTTTDNLFNLPPDGPWVIETLGGLRVRLYAYLDDAARAAVEKFLSDESPELRWLAARVLRHSLDAKDARDLFYDRLRDPSADVQEEIADAIAPHAMKDPRIMPRLLEVSLDSDRVRFKIEDSLREMKLDESQIDWFSRTLATSRDESVRLWSFEVLAAHNPPGFEETAKALLLGDSNPKIREYAAGAVTDQATLARGLDDAEWNVRLACVRGLTDRAALERAANDPDERVRKAARAKLP